MSVATNVLDGAGGLLGGLFGQAANVAHRAKSAAWEKGSDKAFREGMVASCPKSEAPRETNAKFCPQFGVKPQAEAKVCADCGANTG